MDRDVKLLYRQRGSALRRTGQSIVISQAKRPKHGVRAAREPSREREVAVALEPAVDEQPSSPPPLISDGFPDSPVREQTREPTQLPQSPPPRSPPSQLPPSPLMSLPAPDADLGAGLVADLDVDLRTELNASSVVAGHTDAAFLLPAPQFSFSDVPLSRLHSNTVSLSAIEVVSSLINSLFEEQLIPYFFAEFDTATSPEDRLMRKIDIKLYSTFVQAVLTDLRDLLDINASNNELLTQLKQTIKRKGALTQTLLEVRHETADWEAKAGADEQLEELRQKSAVNAKLQALAQDIRTAGAEAPTPTDADRALDDLTAVLDPYNGVLAQLQTFNQSLEKLLE
ncbi:LAQU0S02e09670g1_1 [Lachancea quebecensis]|uniref:LAQU0S02e09670g1_1 n=1 Tax=Lachancea quebecensis TaxID=1654605 RepID=A0A0P1KP37_9SACH|nr:LAQU0S02e09670g1_1 [Lachancea quebecensis]